MGVKTEPSLAAAAVTSTRKPKTEMSPPVRKRYDLTLQAGAQQYGVSVRTLRRRISDGQLPAVRIGKQIRISADDLDALAKPIPAARSAA